MRRELREKLLTLSVSQKLVNYDGEFDIHLARGRIFSANDNYCKLEVKTYFERFSLEESSNFEYEDTCLLDLFQNFITTLNRTIKCPENKK